MNRDNLPLVLIVLDGWGEGPASEGNAITAARPETMRRLRRTYPSTLLAASGEAVGLPDGQIGNSEVGHLSLGAGRVVLQDLPRISRAIESGEFFRNEVLIETIDAARAGDRSVHLLGLFSPGGVHSHIDHLGALLRLARDRGAGSVFVHAFLDGRDVPPKSALPWMREIESGPDAACVATVQGRFYAMDRDNRWERIERAWQALVHGGGRKAASGVEAIEKAYERGETDEFVEPTVVVDGDGAIGRIRDGDAVIHFNFRADRARELTRALALDDCPDLERGSRPELSAYACFTEYDGTFGLPVAFPDVPPEKVFGQVISEAGLRQVRLAETEKYAHVTYFFNGGREEVFEREERVLVPSTRKVATYDLAPEMSAAALTDRVIERIRDGKDDFILVNFANPDMVGHTGVFDAAVKACGIVDGCIGRISGEALARSGCVVVTADHGNCERMVDPDTGAPHTAHTTNPVPCVFVSENLRGSVPREDGRLSDVIPTLLGILGIDQPAEMKGRSLFDG